MGYYSAAPAVTKISFLDQAGDPSTTGDMQRNGDLIKTYDSTSAMPLGFQAVNLSSDATLVDDAFANLSGMKVDVGTNEVWQFLCVLSYDANTTDDIKWNWTGPTSGTMVWAGSGYSNSLGFSNGGNVAVATSYNAGGAGGIALSQWMSGRMSSAGTAGSFQLQAAKQGDAGADGVVYAGSHLIAWRLS